MTADAISFLQSFDPEGRHHLVAINPDTRHVTGKLFEPKAWGEISDWIKANEKNNLYFTVNEPKVDCRDKDGRPASKLNKHHIENIRAVFADVDPDKGKPLEEERARLADLAGKVAAHKSVPASFIIDSGGGVQFFWQLDVKVPAEDHRQWAEEQGRGFAHILGGDAVFNIDRVMRLPGTTNYPDAKKKAAGRKEALARLLVRNTEHTYAPDQLARLVKPAPLEEFEDRSEEIAAVQRALDMSAAHELPIELKQKLATACTNYPLLDQLWRGSETGLIGPDNSGSGFRASLAARLNEIGGFDAQEFAQLLWNWDYAVQGGDPDKKLTARSIARDWVNVGLPRNVDSFFEPLPEPDRDLWEQHAPKEDPVAESVNIRWVDFAEWAGKEPPEREWEVPGWIPRYEVTLLYGDGGIGKTLVAHQYATCAATGRSWLGLPTRKAKVMAFLCEDSEEELHRRQHDINNSLMIEYHELKDTLRISSRKSMDNFLTIWNQHTGEMKRTKVWEALRDEAVRFGAEVIVVDTIADVYSGSEIDRAQVSAFVKSCLGRLAKEINGSVIALGHPSMAGLSSGSGTSGSTAWGNAARSRIYLRYPKGVESGDVRELVGMKLNYGAKGSLLKLRWSSGVFDAFAGTMPQGVGDDLPFADLDTMLVDSVKDALSQLEVQPLTMNEKKVNYAPRVLRFSDKALEDFTEAEIARGLEMIGFKPELWFDKWKKQNAAATEKAAAELDDFWG